MESQPQNPEFRINPENFHPCKYVRFEYSVYSDQLPSLEGSQTGELTKSFFLVVFRFLREQRIVKSVVEKNKC